MQPNNKLRLGRVAIAVGLLISLAGCGTSPMQEAAGNLGLLSVEDTKKCPLPSLDAVGRDSRAQVGKYSIQISKNDDGFGAIDPETGDFCIKYASIYLDGKTIAEGPADGNVLVGNLSRPGLEPPQVKNICYSSEVVIADLNCSIVMKRGNVWQVSLDVFAGACPELEDFPAALTDPRWIDCPGYDFKVIDLSRR